MKRVRDTAILFGFAAAAMALPACPASLDDRCTAGACLPGGSGTDGGGDGDADKPDAPIPPDCKEDADANAPEAKGCMVDTFAVFVDGATGDDANPGTKEKPFKKIGTAIAQGPADGKRRIYVCGPGPYAEHLKLTTAVNIFGGFACGTWLPDSTIKAKVAPTDAGYALHVDNVSAPLRFEDMAFEAVAGTASAPSSVAAFVASSPNVVFKRVELKAGAGASGDDGEAGTTGTPTSGTLDGNSGADVAGGEAKTCTCTTGGSSTGGAGGDVNGTDINGTAGTPTISPPLPDATYSGAGQTQADCNSTVNFPRPGSNAPAAQSAARPSVGVLDAAGWRGGNGGNGQAGVPGQGGGGGGSRTNVGSNNGGGGGGGCGGCGGSGGTGGTAGGSSIALLAFASPVRLVASSLLAESAGAGGTGKDGGSGGGGGGSGQGFKSGCDGNVGGNGGKGGAGAGGAGGISAAVLHKDGLPTNEGSTLEHGGKGAAGTGGKSPDNDGPDGLEGEIVAAP